MALIACKECGEMVSDQALSCPKCGCPIKKVSSAPTLNSNLSIVAFIFSLFTITCVIGFIISIIDLSSSHKDNYRHGLSWFALIWGFLAIVSLIVLVCMYIMGKIKLF